MIVHYFLDSDRLLIVNPDDQPHASSEPYGMLSTPATGEWM
jgi:hypothetical protein